MNLLASRRVAYPTVFQLIEVMYRALQALRKAAQRFNERWESRARTAVALRELGALSDRELTDLGLSRCEIRRIASADTASTVLISTHN